jgi:hypothetical protein
MSRTKLGLDGRDQDLEHSCQVLQNMGELGIPLLCCNFMAQAGWFRSKADVAARGGAQASRFGLQQMPATLTEAREVPVEQVWENYRYWIQRAMPVAEKAGVQMALHADDPPLLSALLQRVAFCVLLLGFVLTVEAAPVPLPLTGVRRAQSSTSRRHLPRWACSSKNGVARDLVGESQIGKDNPSSCPSRTSRWRRFLRKRGETGLKP